MISGTRRWLSTIHQTAHTLRSTDASGVSGRPPVLSSPVPWDALRMYLDFYQLQHAPFPSTPEPAYLFLSPSHQQALAAITSGVAERHGLVLITGASGVGKTTILRAYLAQEHPAQRTTLV